MNTSLRGTLAGCVLLLLACGGKSHQPTALPRATTSEARVLLERTGALEEGDLRAGDGLADHYEIAVRAGDQLMVQVTSSDFDPVLEVTPPGSGAMMNDDWQGDRTRSRIDLLANEAGVLKVRVSSFGAASTGDYRLRVQRVQPEDAANRRPGPASAPAAQATAMLAAGQDMQGVLAPGDATLADGSFFDQITVDVAGRPLALQVHTVEGQPPRVEVVDPRGRALAAESAGSFALVETGTHRVIVAANSAGQRARYQATVRGTGVASPRVNLNRGDHHAPAAAGSTEVQLGQQLRANLESGDTRLPSGESADVYQLQGQAGARIAVEMTSAAFDSYLLVLGPGGQRWEDDDSGGSLNAALELTLPADGAYRIVATSYRAGEGGPYEMKLAERGASSAPTPTVAPAPAIAVSRPIRRSGALAAGDALSPQGQFVDRYTFQWQTGQELVLSASSSELDTYLIVTGPDGSREFNDDASYPADTNSRLAYRVRTSGAHTVLMTSYRAGETGSYELTVEAGAGGAAQATPTPTPTPTTSLAPTPDLGSAPSSQVTVRGELAPGDRQLQSGEFVDAHEFDWPANTAMRIEARSAEFDTYLIVQPPSGTQRDNDDQAQGNTNAAIALVTTAQGRHRVLVTSYQPGEQGRYELTIAGASPAARAGPAPTPAATPTATATATATATGPAQLLAPGQRVQGALASDDAPHASGRVHDTHLVRFDPGQAIRLRLRSQSFDPLMIVTTPSGREITNDDFEPPDLSSGIELPRPEAGAYRVIVTSYGEGQRGPYELTAEGAPPIPVPATSGGSASGAGGRVFGVFVGITDYPEGVNDLPECANDAIKLAQTLREQRLLNENRQVLLTDEQATRSNILQAMRSMAARIQPDDVFIFFYSGHGGRTPGGSSDRREIDGADEYLVAYDGRIMDDEMGSLFDGIRARMSVLALDACYSGGFAKDVITRPGRIGLFSSEEDVTSAVAGAFRAGGYLSHFLRTGIEGEADADPRDGVLTVGELTHYLTVQFGRHVRDVRMSEGYQHLVVDRGAVRTSRVLWAYR